MVEKSPTSEINLRAFLESTGQSLTEAQGALMAGLELPTSMVLSNADLEIKAGMSLNAQGRMVIQPVSAQDVRKKEIEPGALSTLRFSFVGTIGEVVQAPVTSAKPKRPQNEVLEEIRRRDDIAAMDRVLGGLDIKLSYVAERKRWLATVQDTEGRIVRELILPDEVQE